MKSAWIWTSRSSLDATAVPGRWTRLGGEPFDLWIEALVDRVLRSGGLHVPLRWTHDPAEADNTNVSYFDWGTYNRRFAAGLGGSPAALTTVSSASSTSISRAMRHRSLPT